MWRLVHPSPSTAFISVLAFISRDLTMSCFPSVAAICRGVRPKEATLLVFDSGHTTESSVNKDRGTVSGVLQEISFFFRDEFDEQLTRFIVLSSCSDLGESFMDILTLFDNGTMLSI
jgi:hypothetical protein